MTVKKTSKTRTPKDFNKSIEEAERAQVHLDDGSAIPDSADNYNPSDFFVPVSDGSDNLSVNEGFRTTSQSDRQMEIILASKKFPYYVTKGDLLRHALHRHLVYLNKLVPGVAPGIPAIEAIRETQRHQHDMAKYEDQFKAIENTIGLLFSKGQQGVEAARRMVTKIYDDAGRIDDEYWRGYYLETLKKKYGYLLVTEGVSILG